MLKLNDIAAGYGSRVVLNGVNATFKKGRLTSIIGINGCGKSTLLKSIVGIIPIMNGEVYADEYNLSSMRRIEIAQRISYLSQGRSTPDMTVFQMVLHGRFPYLCYPRRYTKTDKDIAYSVMEKVGISSLAQKPLHSLSGGMRQSAYIAMALAQDTDYILLDEPVTYLDISHQLALMKILRELADNGKGIVAVMHDLPLAFNFSDEIAVLNNGKIELQASPYEICKAHVIKNIFGVSINYLSEENKFCYDY